MKKRIPYLLILCSMTLFAQNDLVNVLKKYNKNDVPYMTPTDLQAEKSALILLDSREKKEYDVSHIKNAIFVGYDHFNLKQTEAKIPDKNRKIVVYCTIGVRSEDVAEKLKKAGYKHVYNLYGGIVEWKNTKHQVFNNQNEVTDSVHTYSRKWGQWLTKGIKVYD